MGPRAAPASHGDQRTRQTLEPGAPSTRSSARFHAQDSSDPSSAHEWIPEVLSVHILSESGITGGFIMGSEETLSAVWDFFEFI